MTPRLALTADGDLDCTNGLKIETDAAKSIVGKIRKVFYLFQGAWFMAAADGVPWFQDILAKKNPDLRIVQNILVDALKTVPEVTSVTNVFLTFDRKSRSLVVNWAVNANGQLVSGTTPISTVP